MAGHNLILVIVMVATLLLMVVINMVGHMYNLDANYLLFNGNRILIKRKLFEQYLDDGGVI